MRRPTHLLALCLLLVVALGARAEAAITKVQEIYPACGTGDIAITLPGAVTAGNLVVIGALWEGAGTTADITGDDFAFTSTGMERWGGGDNNPRMEMWWGIGGTDSSFVVDRSSGAGGICVFAIEYAGAHASAPHDATAECTFSSTATTGTHECSPAATQTTAGVIVALARSTTGATWTAGDGMTRLDGWATGDQSAVSHRITTSAGMFTGAHSSAGSETALIYAVSFKAAVVAGGTRSLMTTGAGVGE